MSRVDEWWSEEPRRPPAEYATLLARKRIWRDVERCFIAAVPGIEEVAHDGLLQLDEEMAHALVFVLSLLPKAERRDFADRFYARRRRNRPAWPGAAVRAAAVALMVLPITQRPDLDNARVADLLTAIGQGDDIAITPPTAALEVQKAVARARLDLDLENQLDARAAATTAVVEVLDPSSETPPSQEVLMRGTWATLETTGVDGTLEFLLAVDAL